MNSVFFFVLSGFVVLAALGVLLSRRLAASAFSLFAFLAGVAGLYALFDAHTAATAQLVLYVGGVMILVVFALFLYPESEAPPRLIQVRQHLSKALIVLFTGISLYAILPWEAVDQWATRQQIRSGPIQDMPTIGQNLIDHYILEYELFGILILAAIVVGGWFIHEKTST